MEEIERNLDLEESRRILLGDDEVEQEEVNVVAGGGAVGG